MRQNRLAAGAPPDPLAGGEGAGCRSPRTLPPLSAFRASDMSPKYGRRIDATGLKCSRTVTLVLVKSATETPEATFIIQPIQTFAEDVSIWSVPDRWIIHVAQ